MDYSKLTNVEVNGINTKDAPDFCDAYISYAEYKGIECSESQLDELNSDSSFVYEQIIATIY